METASAGTSDPTRKKLSDWLCHLVYDDRELPVAHLRDKFVHFREEIIQNPTEIFVQIIKLLKSMPNLLSTKASKPSHALILLQLLLECITQCPIVDLQCLHMLINTVRVFCVWPKPYGTIARNIFKILVLEKRSPGGTMRARLHRERMQITHDSDLYIFGSRGQQLAATQPPTTPVMVYFDESNAAAYSLQGIVSKDICIAANNTDQRLLLNLVEINFEITESVAKLLENIPADENAALRKKIEQVMIESTETISKGDHFSRTQSVATILKRYVPTTELKPRTVGGAFKYLPSFPEIQYTFQALASNRIDTARPKVFEGGEYLAKHTTDLMNILTAANVRVLKILNSRKKNCRHVLYQSTRKLLQRGSGRVIALDDRTSEPKPVLNFAIVGTDRTLHRFLRGFVAIHEPLGAICKQTEIRLYMIPSQPKYNDLAAYISRIDPWYLKYVYGPFTQLKQGASSKKVYKQLLEDYIGSAHYTVPFRIYQCECWKDASESECTVKIPFCTSASIGVETAVENLVQETKEKITWEAAFVQLREADRHQLCTPELRIKHSQVNGGGSDFETPRSYAMVNMRSVPHIRDQTPTDLPVLAHLQLELLASDYFKDYTRKKKSRATDPGVLQAVLEKRRETHFAGSVEIKCIKPDEKMLVMLDGVVYGPFHHIAVSQYTVDATRRPLYLPIRNFILHRF